MCFRKVFLKKVYEKISELLQLRRIDRLIGVGPRISAYRDLFPMRTCFFASTEEFMASMSPSDFSKELILLKGAPEFAFSRIEEMLEARQHETVLEVNLDALVYNFNFYRSHLRPDTKIVCMLKAFGYGAGSYELAKTLQKQGAAYIAVAAHDEGAALREAGITMPIMVLNPKVVNYKTLFDNKLEPEIFSFEMLKEIVREAEKFHIKDYPIHVKIDSGMHRLGFLYEELPELIELIRSQGYVRPMSIFSHLATADDLENDDYARRQLDYFDRCSRLFLEAFDYPILRHVLNTDGVLRFPEYQYEMVRWASDCTEFRHWAKATMIICIRCLRCARSSSKYASGNKAQPSVMGGKASCNAGRASRRFRWDMPTGWTGGSDAGAEKWS